VRSRSSPTDYGPGHRSEARAGDRDDRAGCIGEHGGAGAAHSRQLRSRATTDSDSAPEAGALARIQARSGGLGIPPAACSPSRRLNTALA
jgi:hypothetical protein